MSTGTREIAIYGAGGFGREIACLIRKINEANPSEGQWKLIGFFDDGVPVGTRNAYGEVLGGIDILNAFPRQLGVVVAIATPAVLLSLPEKIKNPNIYFPNLIAPDVVFFDPVSISVGRGNVVGWGSRISCNVSLGDFNIAVGSLSVGHDSQIGNGNAMFPETRISGGCQIGDGNFFGMRSAVLQYVKIGNNTRIGAGSFVVRKTKDGFLYTGNPARKTEL
ncbi:MAG: hypothetical protein J6L64_03760 [Opitutales bacterium]|nr:hypothetical protein [Opitutales bacterium]